MGVLKSLGLSPAKAAGAKAIRRLLGRVLPTESEGASASISASASASDTDQIGKSNAGNKVDNRKGLSEELQDSNKTQATNSNTDSSPSSSTARHQETPANTDHHKQDDPSTTETAVTTGDMSSPQKQRIPNAEMNKENQPPNTAHLSESLSCLELGRDETALNLKPSVPVTPAAPIFADPAILAERAVHMQFTEAALDMARLALRTNETPVGCVLVHDGKIIARGMNATNVTRNGTRHAEFMALGALLSYPPKDGLRTTYLKPKLEDQSVAGSDASSVESGSPDEGNEDGSKGHLYPYGQKCHPDARVDRSIIRESILYVTVEPCVMCASLLRQLGIKKVYFGAVNDKFGGTGGVFSIHANSLPVSADGQTASAHPTPKPAQLPDGSGTLGVSYPPGGGDGGNIESGYEIEGGWGRDEAVALLRRFYVQENGRAPVPRKKEGRAARLAAMMEGDGNGDETPGLDEVTPVPDNEAIDLPTSTETLAEPAPLADRTNT
ncbi:TAD2-tRNA-specific adenosine deaminase 2 [Fusarium heterosporum]|uniref:TAD2-tRNA-specific adenosine deaminase 2 n=1 Tax=Fusarium heterosporum TaxID=42747 RepID=A0A8H5SV90_FUSHE|nr:TAD2-tRNA-specific adenosine deaminase 2 [Fusarium heterosporum]